MFLKGFWLFFKLISEDKKYKTEKLSWLFLSSVKLQHEGGLRRHKKIR